MKNIRTWSKLVALMLGLALFATAANAGANAQPGLRAGGMDAAQTFKHPAVVALVQAIEREDLTGIDQALKRGADINLAGDGGQTPLHWSLLKVGIAVKTVKYLLDRGADPNRAMNNGTTVLHFTAGGNRPDLLELFLQNRGDANALNRLRDTPLAKAIISQYDVNVQLLLRYGADPNVGETCLATVGNARFDFTVELLKHGLTKDLALCGRLVQRAVIRAESPREVWRTRVFELLAAQGVLPPFEVK
jgi:Ankyrin repeats (3 copies)